MTEKQESFAKVSDLNLYPSITHHWWARLLLLITVLTILLVNAGGVITDAMAITFIALLVGYGVESILCLRRRSEPDNDSKISLFVGPIDSIVLGYTALLTGLVLANVLTILLLAVVNTIYDRKNPVKWLNLPLFALGAGICLFTISPPLTYTYFESGAIPMVVLSGTCLYLVLGSIQSDLHLSSLSTAVEKLNRTQIDLKLKQYQLAKYISPALRETIGSNRDNRVKTSRKKLTIFFSDLVSFTEIAEDLEGPQLTEILNSYLTEMSDIAFRYGGTIDKFMGDGIMIFFGDPYSDGVKEDAVKCVQMALEMRRRMEELSRQWQSLGVPESLQIRFGINTGFCAVGNFGTNNRLDYTLLGTEVNIASRLEASAAPNEILISDATYQLVKDQLVCEEKGLTVLKGINRKVTSYRVIDSRENLGPNKTYLDIKGEGYSLYVDMELIDPDESRSIIATLGEIVGQLKEHQK